MPHNLDLILTLTGGLAAALALGYVTQRLGLSPIVGYLLAGIAVGPHTPGFVADRHLAEQLAEIGVILLMFGVGLHFHLEQLLAVRRVAIPGAVGRIVLATALGAVVAHAFGWSWTAGIVFGLAISVASTVVLVRVLTDNRDLHTPTGHIAVGWVVVEDLFTVVVLVLLPALIGAQADGPARVPMALAVAALKIAALVAFTLLVGGRVIPWLLEHVAGTRSRELFSLTVLVLALGIAVGSATLFGVSMALGAFLAGMVVGRSEFSLRAASEVAADAGRLRRPVLRLRRDALRPGPPAGGAGAGGRDARDHPAWARRSSRSRSWSCSATRSRSAWRWPWPWPRSASSPSSWGCSGASWASSRRPP